MKLSVSIFLLAAATALVSVGASAQAAPDISKPLGYLADQPAAHFGMVFDRSMLQAARSVLESGGMTPERAAAALNSISYDNYRYHDPAIYTKDAMNEIITAYRAAGWKHLVNAHDSHPTVAVTHGTATDLWLHFNGTDVDGLTVLTRGVKNVNVVQVACDLRPIELLHLGGHFGIPKIDPDAVMVPAPDNR